jgi:hypothetical protein
MFEILLISDQFARMSAVLLFESSHFPLPESRTVKANCEDCKGEVENWLCLSCYKVFCGRWTTGFFFFLLFFPIRDSISSLLLIVTPPSRMIQAHMVKHSKESHHCLVASFADLSFWCYNCDSYVLAEVQQDCLALSAGCSIIRFNPSPAGTRVNICYSSYVQIRLRTW